jgi:hypothetical protein
VEHGSFTAPILLDFDTGKTPAGLSTGQVAISAAFTVRVDRFRIGGGPELSYFWMFRPSSSVLADAVGLGVSLLASFDVIELGDDRAIALMLRGEAIWLNESSAARTTSTTPKPSAKTSSRASISTR